MEFADRLAVAALVMTFLGLGITILWPTQRWIGWMSLSIALVLGTWWGWLELSSRWHKKESIASAPEKKDSPPVLEEPKKEPPTIKGTLKNVKPLRPKETKTEVALEFAGRDSLRVQMANTTDNAAEKPKWWFMMIDATNCFVWPEKLVWSEKPSGCQPLPLQTMTYNDDYINGMSRLGPYDVLSISFEGMAKQHVKTGDEVVGQISTTCFNCSKSRTYYIYFKDGVGGWLYPIPDAKSKDIKFPSGRLPNIPSLVLKEFLEKQVPVKDRIEIPE